MIKNYHYFIKVYIKSLLLTILVVSGLSLSPLFGKSSSYYETSSKKVASFEVKNNLFSVSDSISNYEDAEELWGSINFAEMQREIEAALKLPLVDATIYWEYLQLLIYNDKLNFLNGGYRSLTFSDFPKYVDSLTQAYIIKQYPDFLPNKAAFELQLAEQKTLNTVQAVNGPCTNMGFTNGLTGWTVYHANACASNPALNPCNVAAGQSPAGYVNLLPLAAPTPRVNVKTAPGTDPLIPAITLTPPGATNSVMIEDYLNGGNASEISQTFLVTATNNIFTYKYAVVLEDPVNSGNPHAYNQRPFFKVTMTASTSGEIACAEYVQVAQPPVTSFDSATIPNPYYNPPYGQTKDPVQAYANLVLYYRNWTTITIPLQAYIGQNVTVTFIASDCQPGGHRGYAYIWSECSSLPLIEDTFICLSETLSYNVPEGFESYEWIGPGIVGRNDTSVVKINEAGAYSLALTSVPTTPTTKPCYDTVKFNVLQHCAPKPILDSLCETIAGAATPTATGVNLTKYNTQITAFNSKGTVQGWYSALPASAATLIATPTNVTVSNLSKYYAVITYPTIGGDTAELEFKVNPLPVIAIPAYGPFCAGAAPVSLTGITPAGGILTGTNVSATGVFTPSAAGKDTIKYVYTTPSGCKDSATQVIVVNPPPTAAAPNQTVCSTVTSISLSGTATNYTSLKWTNADGGTSFSAPTSTTTTYTPTVAELAGSAINLDFIAEPLAGCKADTQKVVITCSYP